MGKEIIAKNQWHIFDREGYIVNLKTKIPELDETIEVYFDDALSTFRTNNHRASIILLGRASEKLIKLLRDSIVKKREDCEKLKNMDSVVVIFNKIENLISDKIIELDWTQKETFVKIIKPVFEGLRITRNEAIHPSETHKVIYREDAKRYLLLFPDYCERVYKLIDHFKSQQTSN